MMTGYCPRRNIPRAPYPSCPKRPPIRDDPLYYLRSILLPRFLLSLLPRQPRPNSRTRRLLTPYRNYPSRPLRSPPAQYSRPTSLRGHGHLGTPQYHRRTSKRSNPVPHFNYPSRLLLYLPSSNRILRSPLHYCRRSLWFHLLRSNRLPRTPRNHWLHLPSHLPSTTSTISFHLRTPLWF